jgi:hypothetical protein
LVVQAGVVVDTLLALIIHTKEPLAGRKMVYLVVAEQGVQRKALLELQGAVTLLAVAVAVGVTLRRLVLAVLAVLRLVVAAVEHLLTALILVLAVLAVMALSASTLGKELT